MKWLKTCIALIVAIAWTTIGSASAAPNGPANVLPPIVPNELAVTICEVKEFVTLIDTATGDTVRVLKKDVPMQGSGWMILPPQVHNWKDLEWNIVQGKLDCEHIITPVWKAGGLGGDVPTTTDLSRHLQCMQAAVSIAPKFMEQYPGWAVMSAGCPNPRWFNNNTPEDYTDDFIIGYEMPECPTSIGGIEIECEFTKQEL